MNKRSKASLIFWGLALLGLAFGLSACGLSQLSPSKDADEAEAQIHLPASSQSSPERAEAAVQSPAPIEGKDGGSTRSGPGRPAWVRVRPGDTLWSIAARKDIYASGWYYPLLVHANAALLPDPSHPRAGIRLKVPRDLPWARVEIAQEEAMTGQLLKAGPKSVPRPGSGLGLTPKPAARSVPGVRPSPLPIQKPSPAPTLPPEARPMDVPVAQPPAPRPGFGGAVWFLVLLLLAAVSALVWFLRRGGD